MKFVVFQCTEDPEFFIVTDEAHKANVTGELCPNGGKLKEVGDFPEMGEIRAAFDEKLAKESIEARGFYRFEAPSMSAVPPAPEMP